VKTGSSGFHQDVPKEDVTIIKATILEEWSCTRALSSFLIFT
jgi:hypothetical protein